jgi:HAD superfamily hydrolase (TIGR01458 family)
MKGALLLDIKGVLVDDRAPLPGAIEAVREARAEGWLIRFVTNTATRAHGEILRELSGLGFAIEEPELITAPLAARSYVMRRSWRAHALVHPAIAPLFSDLRPGPAAGHDGLAPPDCVVLGDARDELSYRNLNEIFRHVRAGSTLIGIGRNRCFREAGEWFLDAGAFLQAIEWAARCEALVMGKPDPSFFSEVVASTGLPADRCLMIGDDVDADVAGAITSGIRGCLVRTGKFQDSDLQRLPAAAAVINGIAAWRSALNGPA